MGRDEDEKSLDDDGVAPTPLPIHRREGTFEGQSHCSRAEEEEEVGEREKSLRRSVGGAAAFGVWVGAEGGNPSPPPPLFRRRHLRPWEDAGGRNCQLISSPTSFLLGLRPLSRPTPPSSSPVHSFAPPPFSFYLQVGRFEIPPISCFLQVILKALLHCRGERRQIQ